MRKHLMTFVVTVALGGAGLVGCSSSGTPSTTGKGGNGGATTGKGGAAGGAAGAGGGAAGAGGGAAGAGGGAAGAAGGAAGGAGGGGGAGAGGGSTGSAGASGVNAGFLNAPAASGVQAITPTRTAPTVVYPTCP